METIAERLGFERGDRVAIVHADDIGMCDAQSDGAFEALRNGPATCGSLMVPCPGFAAAAERAREHPQLDLGVHLTLTSEWPSLRWGPVLGAEAVPSLVDATSCFPRTAAEV
ncbi:MAG: ChbG/HpnK family deacetylase, partial [Myxococcota bacterium]